MPDPTFIPAAYSERFCKVFAWYTARLLRKHFHNIRLETATKDSNTALTTIQQHTGPAILLATHSAWWDPLILFWAVQSWLPAPANIKRKQFGPMDAAELSRFKFLRKIGCFGINPDDPRALPLVREYAVNQLTTTPAAVLAITPQGDFADPRDTIRVRPGAAAIAATLSQSPNHKPLVVALAIEYTFWTDQHPEIFLRLKLADHDHLGSTAAWHRAITDAMQYNADQLADAVRSRDPQRFAILLGKGEKLRINPAYDLILKLTKRQHPLREMRSAKHDASSDAAEQKSTSVSNASEPSS